MHERVAAMDVQPHVGEDNRWDKDTFQNLILFLFYLWKHGLTRGATENALWSENINDILCLIHV